MHLAIGEHGDRISIGCLKFPSSFKSPSTAAGGLSDLVPLIRDRREISLMLSAEMLAAFPGRLLEGEVAKKNVRAFRLDDRIAWVCLKLLDRFVFF